MFGEYALYCGEKVVALVCDDQLFVKITDAGRTLVGASYPEDSPYPGAKAAFLVGADHIDDGERLAELIRLTAAALPARPPKARKKKAQTKAAKPRSKKVGRKG